jgi:hypothetical protein
MPKQRQFAINGNAMLTESSDRSIEVHCVPEDDGHPYHQIQGAGYDGNP